MHSASSRTCLHFDSISHVSGLKIACSRAEGRFRAPYKETLNIAWLEGIFGFFYLYLSPSPATGLGGALGAWECGSGDRSTYLSSSHLPPSGSSSGSPSIGSFSCSCRSDCRTPGCVVMSSCWSHCLGLSGSIGRSCCVAHGLGFFGSSGEDRVFRRRCGFGLNWNRVEDGDFAGWRSGRQSRLFSVDIRSLPFVPIEVIFGEAVVLASFRALPWAAARFEGMWGVE
jgi:hypothetical protein